MCERQKCDGFVIVWYLGFESPHFFEIDQLIDNLQ